MSSLLPRIWDQERYLTSSKVPKERIGLGGGTGANIGKGGDSIGGTGGEGICGGEAPPRHHRRLLNQQDNQQDPPQGPRRHH
nr:hypothetical protein [Tanacetum cinerariifolium]